MTDPQDPGQEETAQAIFDRINRRRAAADAARRAKAQPREAAVPVTVAESGTTPESASAAALRIDELLDDGPGAVVPPATEDTMPDDDTFPRSATMRMLMRHPALALGVGVPAAVLLLRTPASRRLLRTGLILGARPEVRALLAVSMATASRLLENGRHGAADAIADPRPDARSARSSASANSSANSSPSARKRADTSKGQKKPRGDAGPNQGGNFDEMAATGNPRA